MLAEGSTNNLIRPSPVKQLNLCTDQPHGISCIHGHPRQLAKQFLWDHFEIQPCLLLLRPEAKPLKHSQHTSAQTEHTLHAFERDIRSGRGERNEKMLKRQSSSKSVSSCSDTSRVRSACNMRSLKTSHTGQNFPIVYFDWGGARKLYTSGSQHSPCERCTCIYWRI